MDILSLYAVDYLSILPSSQPTDEGSQMAKREPKYALSIELADGTCEPPYFRVANKRLALKLARQAAKDFAENARLTGIVRVWVDACEQGIASFSVEAS